MAYLEDSHQLVKRILVSLATTMAYLEDRPQLFRLVVEEWVVLRRGALSRNFLHSLTHLSPTHSPIELGAHSPTRYVGDMLAWLHQALAGERDVMGALFGGCKSLDVAAETSSSLASIAESVCRPLKTRIEQMIVSGEPTRLRSPSHRRTSAADAPTVSRKPVILYKMRGLLQFYSNTIEQLTGAGVLVCALEELQQLCHKMFLAALQTQVEEGCEHLPAPPSSLAPSATVTSLLSLLSDVITAATLTTHHQRDHAAEVVELVIDPLLSSLNSSSSTDAGVVEAHVYLLNCCHLLHSTVSLLHTSNTPDKLKQIEEVSEGAVSVLSEQQTTAVLLSISLLPMVPHITTAAANGGLVGDSPLAALPYTSPSAVQSFLAKLDHFLSNPDAYQLPALRLLVSSQHRQQVSQRCNSALLHHYTSLHTLVHSVPAAGYPTPQKLMPKTPDMIRALAGL
ncbi:Conserved oligomeric Golgi complex subunit 6 [Trinorchestia longiramus]|nr:Conserved oligomeric Golgi complex subunit 6 [Trinorchestia longiramus]